MEEGILRLIIEALVGMVITMLGIYVRSLEKKLEAMMISVHLLQVGMNRDFATKSELLLLSEHLDHVAEDVSDVKAKIAAIDVKLDVKSKQ